MSATSTEGPKRQPSRRAVLRVGAHAAWAVPAIQVASAVPAFAASGTAGTLPTSQLSVTVLGHTRNADGTGYVVLQVGASAAPAKNVVVTVTGYDRLGSQVTEGPFSLVAGEKVVRTIALSFGTRARTLQIAVTGTTDNQGAAAAVGQTVSYSVPATTMSTVKTAVLKISGARATLTSVTSSRIDFTISTDLAVKNVAWTVTRSNGVVFASGTIASIRAKSSVSVTASNTASWPNVLTFKATAVTDDANHYPASPATATALGY